MHHVGADHIRAIARKPPARQVETVRRFCLAGDTARANVVAEGRRIADGRSAIARDEVEPGERTAREILGLQIIGRDLVGDRRQEAADQSHVVIPGQPRHAAVALHKLHAVRVRGKVVEESRVRDRDAVRKARRAAGILQIGDVCAARARQRHLGCDTLGQRFPVDALDPGGARGVRAELRQLGRID